METKKVIYKTIGVFIFCMQVFFSFAQRGGVELTIAQPSPNLNIRLLHDKYYLISGQQYTIIVQNLSGKNMHIKGQLVAVLVCGNEVSTRFDEVLKPYEKKGGDIDDGSGMTGSVNKDDCHNPEIVLSDKGIEEHNLIRTLQLRSYSSIIEKTEEEKVEEQKQKQQAVEQKQQQEKQQQQQQVAAQQQQQQAASNRQQQQREYQNKMNALQQQLAAKQQANAEIANTFSQGLNEIADMIAKKQQKENAEREEQRIQDQMDRLERENDNAQLQKERAVNQRNADATNLAAHNAEQKKIAEQNANIAMWQNKSSNILAGSLAEKAKIKKTSQITDQALQSIYYVIWNFSSIENQVIISEPIEIKKDGDGDWPLNKDLLQKIQTKSKLIINQTPDRITTSENRLGYLLGYYTNAGEALKATEDIKANALNNGYTIKNIEAAPLEVKKTSEEKKKETNDFWKE